MHILIYTWILSLSLLGGSDRDFSKQNISYQYSANSIVALDHKVASDDDEIVVFLRLTEFSASSALEDFVLSGQFCESYRAAQSEYGITLNTASSKIYEDDNVSVFRWVFSNDREANLLLLKFDFLGTTYYYDIELRHAGQDYPSFLIWNEAEDLPVFESYLSINQPVSFSNVMQEEENDVIGYFYKHEFPASLPPSSMQGPKVSREMTLDSLLSIPYNTTVSFDKRGLYFFQSDTNATAGVTLLVGNSTFPRYGQLQDLVPPTLYISTRMEYQELLNNTSSKAAFDKFWVKLSREEQRARRIIRDFYRSVTAANETFSSYKDGWKTDQGMIFTIMGEPDEVYRNDVGEVWIYEKSVFTDELIFNFERIPNIFAPHNYVLVRSKKYRTDWNQKIRLWREGTRKL